MRAEADLVQDIGIPFEPGSAGARSSVPAVTAGLRIFFCALVLALGPMAWWQRHGWPVHHSLPPTSFLKHGGAAFQAAIPGSFFTRRLTDGSDAGQVSDLRIFEAGKELGPNHTPAGAIESHSGGAFNDWEGSVVLSTSDGSDPRGNGRLYEAAYRAYPSPAAQVAAAAVCALAGLLAAEITVLLRLRSWPRPTRWTGAQRRHIVTTVALYGGAATLVHLSLHGLEVRATLPPGGISSFEGFAYSAGLPTPLAPLFEGSGDDAPGGSWSNLKLTEDGRPLGPAHAPHAQIRSEGRGAYSHWGDGVVFSATDGSDPRENDRSYEVAYRVYLRPAFAWAGLAFCGMAVLLRLFYRHSAAWIDFAPRAVGRSPRAAAVDGTQSPFRPSSLLRFGSLIVVYTAALLLLYGSLVASQSDSGGFKINFEYKAF